MANAIVTAEYSGIVFDLDGVLIDTEPIYLETINSILGDYGVKPLLGSDYTEFVGKFADYTWPTLGDRYQLPASHAQLRDSYDQRLLEILPARLRLRPEAALLLAAVEERAIKRAVATSSRKKWLELKISVLGLETYFGAAVSGEEVGKFKPEPDVFRVAAERAGIDPSRAIAIEDSPAGITSAKRAGMRVFALRTESTTGLDLSEADDVIDSLGEIDLGILFGTRNGGHAPSVV